MVSQIAVARTTDLKGGDVAGECARHPQTRTMNKSGIIALAKAMISRSFPTLQGMKLNLKILDADDYVMAVRLKGKEIHLGVSRDDAGRMKRIVLPGVLAHELCHAEEDSRRGPFLEA